MDSHATSRTTSASTFLAIGVPWSRFLGCRPLISRFLNVLTDLAAFHIASNIGAAVIVDPAWMNVNGLPLLRVSFLPGGSTNAVQSLTDFNRDDFSKAGTWSGKLSDHVPFQRSQMCIIEHLGFRMTRNGDEFFHRQFFPPRYGVNRR